MRQSKVQISKAVRLQLAAQCKSIQVSSKFRYLQSCIICPDRDYGMCHGAVISVQDNLVSIQWEATSSMTNRRIVNKGRSEEGYSSLFVSAKDILCDSCIALLCLGYFGPLQ